MRELDGSSWEEKACAGPGTTTRDTGDAKNTIYSVPDHRTTETGFVVPPDAWRRPRNRLSRRDSSVSCPTEPVKVAQLLQLVTTVLYKPRTQILHEQWQAEDDDEEPDDESTAKTRRRRQRTCAMRCNECCQHACYNPLCCCIQCGGFSFFFILICGIGFAIFFYGTRWLVAWYKVE